MENFLLHLAKTSAIGSALIILALLLRPVLQKYFTAKARYWLWLVLAAALLPAPIYTGSGAPVQITPPSEHVFVWTDTQAIAPKIVHKEVFVPEDVTPALSSGKPLSDFAVPTRRIVEVSTVLFWAWLAGIAVFLTVQGVGYVKFRRLTRRWSSEATDIHYDEILRKEADTLGVSAPKLTVCSAIPTPALTGLARPTLLLPHEDYTDTELRFILRHELYHCKRCDILYKLVLTLANAIHWFNPLVYLMLRAADEDIELSCDSAVTRGMEQAERTAYSETLLKSVREKGSAVALTTCFGSTLGRLKRRLANVFDSEKKRRGGAVIAFAVIAAAALSAAIGFAPAKEKASENPVKRSGEYADVEDYLMHKMPAIGEKVSYHTASGIENSASFYPSEKEAAVIDRKLTWLNQSGELSGLATEGKLQSWKYRYLLQLDAPTEDVLLAAGMYEEDGWVDLEGQDGHDLVVLQYADGSIDALYDAPVNDNMDFYGYHRSYEEALYDWYVTHYNLDRTEYPLYVSELQLSHSADANGNEIYDMCPVHRYDGDGWYIYIPVNGWEPGVGEPIWYSGYGTESTIVVKTFDTPLDQAQAYFKREGWEGMNNDMIFVSYQDRFSNVYLYERPAGGHYEVQLFADFEKMAEIAETCPEVDRETSILIHMAQSFTVDKRFTGALERVAFDNIMGLSGFYSETTDGAGFITRQYYVPAVVGGYTPIGESFGYTIDDHIVDLDGDGVTELVCNCQYGADGAQRVFVYQLDTREGIIEQGTYYPVYSALPDYNDWGVNSSREYYDADTGEFVLEYDTKSGGTAAKKFSYREMSIIPYTANDTPFPAPLLPGKTPAAPAESGTEVNTPSNVMEIDGKSVQLTANGYTWYVRTDGWICREKNGTVETLYELPVDFYTDAVVLPSLAIKDGYVTLSYHSGGGFMGSDMAIRFLDDGSYVELPANSATVTDGDLWVSASIGVPPRADNLSISRDGGKSWSALGSADYSYCWYYEVREGTTSGLVNGRIELFDGYAYLLGSRVSADDSAKIPYTAVCRVDLTTGETEELTGEAKAFSIVGQWIQYTSPNGTGHTCPLTGDLTG